MEQKVENEYLSGHLPTHLKGLDSVLCGGIPFGVLTELVGPPGIGKSQVTLFTAFDVVLLLSSQRLVKVLSLCIGAVLHEACSVSFVS